MRLPYSVCIAGCLPKLPTGNVFSYYWKLMLYYVFQILEDTFKKTEHMNRNKVDNPATLRY